MNGGTCPCGTGIDYEQCCGTIHDGGAGLGVTAEALMRARYSAYARRDEAFLARSWHPDTRPDPIDPDPTIVWQGLEIVDTEAGGGLDQNGIVEFRASYEVGGKQSELHERSSFVRLEGHWVYVAAT